MKKDVAIDLLRDSGLNEVDALIPLLRPSIRIATQRLDREPSHDSSKFGGMPLLPSGFDWPRWDITANCESKIESTRKRLPKARNPSRLEKRIAELENDLKQPHRPLDFLAEIKLSEVSELNSGVGLPPNGRLLFFYDVHRSTWGFDPADRGSWRVIHVKDGDTLMRTEKPVIADRPTNFRPCVLDLSMEYVLSQDMRTYGIDCRVWNDEGGYGKLYESLVENRETIHRIGGYPEVVQNPMELECQLVSNGLYCGNSDGYKDARREILEAGAKDWKLLLQIDSDDRTGWMWGDVGRIYFWIRADDLRDGDFNNVWCILQCH